MTKNILEDLTVPPQKDSVLNKPFIGRQKNRKNKKRHQRKFSRQRVGDRGITDVSLYEQANRILGIGRQKRKVKHLPCSGTFSSNRKEHEVEPKYRAYFDGSCEPTNPGGAMGFGVVIKQGAAVVYEASGMVSAGKENSNNVAEYIAYMTALDWFEKNSSLHDRIIIYGDSKLVIEQMFGSWKIRDGMYTVFAKAAKIKRNKFPMISGQWIPREQNTECDDLSKSSLLKAGIKVIDRG